MDARTQAKRQRYAVNAWRLLTRRDARSVRRCKHWLRLCDGPEHLLTAAQQRRPQASFQLACDASGIDPNRWNELPVHTPETINAAFS